MSIVLFPHNNDAKMATDQNVYRACEITVVLICPLFSSWKVDVLVYKSVAVLVYNSLAVLVYERVAVFDIEFMTVAVFRHL